MYTILVFYCPKMPPRRWGPATHHQKNHLKGVTRSTAEGQKRCRITEYLQIKYTVYCIKYVENILQIDIIQIYQEHGRNHPKSMSLQRNFVSEHVSCMFDTILSGTLITLDLSSASQKGGFQPSFDRKVAPPALEIPVVLMAGLAAASTAVPRGIRFEAWARKVQGNRDQRGEEADHLWWASEMLRNWKAFRNVGSVMFGIGPIAKHASTPHPYLSQGWTDPVGSCWFCNLGSLSRHLLANCPGGRISVHHSTTVWPFGKCKYPTFDATVMDTFCLKLCLNKTFCVQKTKVSTVLFVWVFVCLFFLCSFYVVVLLCSAKLPPKMTRDGRSLYRCLQGPAKQSMTAARQEARRRCKGSAPSARQWPARLWQPTGLCASTAGAQEEIYMSQTPKKRKRTIKNHSKIENSLSLDALQYDHWCMMDVWLMYDWCMIDVWLMYDWFMIDVWLIDVWWMYVWCMIDVWCMMIIVW